MDCTNAPGTSTHTVARSQQKRYLSMLRNWVKNTILFYAHSYFPVIIGFFFRKRQAFAYLQGAINQREKKAKKNDKLEFVKVFFSLNLFGYYPANYIIFVHCNFVCANVIEMRRENSPVKQRSSNYTTSNERKNVIVLVLLPLARKQC